MKLAAAVGRLDAAWAALDAAGAVEIDIEAATMVIDDDAPLELLRELRDAEVAVRSAVDARRAIRRRSRRRVLRVHRCRTVARRAGRRARAARRRAVCRLEPASGDCDGSHERLAEERLQ